MSNLIKNGIIQAKDVYGVKFEVDLIPETNKYRRLNSNTKKEWINLKHPLLTCLAECD